MNTLTVTQLNVQLASILKRVQSLRRLELAEETERRKALAESQRLLGAIALYRHGLERVALLRTPQLRRAS